MVCLPQDVAFIEKVMEVSRAKGVMRHPTFDGGSCQLVESDLRLDLYNLWHRSWQLRHRDSEAIVGHWIAPTNLEQACYFGRVDVVQARIQADTPLDGRDCGGDPIAAAIEACVVTPLHVRCVELLFAAGVPVTHTQFDSHGVESMGTRLDFQIFDLLLERASRSPDTTLRERAAKWLRGEYRHVTEPARGRNRAR